MATFDDFMKLDIRVGEISKVELFVGLAEIIIGFSNILTYFSVGTTINLGTGILCLLLGILIGYGYLRIYRKKKQLKKELQLFE